MIYILCNDVLFYRLEYLLLFHEEENKRQKLSKWEDSVTRMKELMGNCEDKLEELKSKGDPKDSKDAEEQIILANVRLKFVCLFLFLHLFFVCVLLLFLLCFLSFLLRNDNLLLLFTLIKFFPYVMKI